MKNESNPNIKIENKKPPIFILLLFIIVVIILYGIYKIGLNYQPMTIIEYKGYAVNGKELVENLLRTDLNGKKFIEPLSIEEDTVVYKKIASYYIGDNQKDKINLEYPIFINNNQALYNILNQNLFYTTDLEEIEGYANTTITNGVLYNDTDLKRADGNDYLFIKNSDNVWINTKKISIKTVANSYEIPTNSIIYFKNNTISYYYLQDGAFTYATIVDLEDTSKVIFEKETIEYQFNTGETKVYTKEISYNYKQFLLDLNIIKEKTALKPKDEVAKENNTSTIKDHENEIKDNHKNEVINKPENEVKIPWQKPTVIATEIIPNVYTADTRLSIYDPSGAIKTSIVFEIYQNNKIYIRNQAISSGNLKLGILQPNTEYTIKGIYRYNTEAGKTVEVEFIHQNIKTKDTSILESLELGFENGTIYSNKIEISNLKLVSDMSSTLETRSGIKRGELIINHKIYEMKTSDLRRLINGYSITIQSANNLSSNTVIPFEIKLYDVTNQELLLKNNVGQTRTCMQVPQISFLVKSNKDISVSFEIKYDNPDDVFLRNQHYILYDTNNNVVEKGLIEQNSITLHNLELAKFYTIRAFADYDLNNNLPLIEEGLLGEYSFSTSRIDQYGELYVDLNVDSKNLTDHSAIAEITINSTINKTNLQLISMFQNANINILQNNEIVKTIPFTKEDFDLWKKGETVFITLDHLDSNTNYSIQVVANAKAGNTRKDFKAIINGNKTFSTFKKEAQIYIKNLFVLKDKIDFDINIFDVDGSIRNKNIALELYSTKNELFHRQEIAVSNDSNKYTRVQITNLNENEKYYLSLFTDRYSIRNEESTIKEKYFNIQGDEKRFNKTQIQNKNVSAIWTNNVGGKITLESIKKNIKDIKGNLIDVESNINWYASCFNTDRGYLKEYDKKSNILKLGLGQGTSQIYIFDLKSSMPQYAGEKLDISFKYRKSDDNLSFYLQKGKDFDSDRLLQINNEEYIEDNGWYTFQQDESIQEITTNQYIGFQIIGNSNNYIEIKDLKIKIKSDIEEETIEVDYQPFFYDITSYFSLDLNLYNEKLNEIGYNTNVTNGIYYIQIEDLTNHKVTNIKYEDYIVTAKTDNGIDDNSIENQIKMLDLQEDRDYQISLILKNPEKENREYILNTIEVSTKKNEIKNISSINDYLGIQPNGSYIFSTNLNLGSDDYLFGNSDITFNGLLDFNGKTIKRTIEPKNDAKHKYYLFYNFSREAIVENLCFDLDINLKTNNGGANVTIDEKNSGLVYRNNGILKNLMVNLRSCTNSPNKDFAIIGYENYGTLENFVICLRSNFYIGGNGALGFVKCSDGVICNGYITPFPNKNYSIKPIECMRSTDATDSGIYIAGLASIVENSEISSVYSLVNIHNKDENANNADDAKIYAGNLVSYTNNSTIRNCYSVGIGNITLERSNDSKIGPTIAYPYSIDSKNLIQDVCYFDDTNSMKNNEYNIKISTAALSNQEFQEQLLNYEGSGNQFIINNTIKTFFPKIKLPDIMPSQLSIPMKKSESTDADILTVNVIEDGDTEKLVEITLYNPKEAKIEKIEIEGLEVDPYRIHNEKYCISESAFEKCSGNHDEHGYCLDKNGNKILVAEDGYTQQYLSGQTTKLITKIKIAEEETTDELGFDNKHYVSTYYLKSLKAKGYTEKRYIEDDGTKTIINEIKLKYFYQISNLNQWRRINQYPDENYRIVQDLDFSNKDYNYFSIVSPFTGILTGEHVNGNETKIATIFNIGSDATETHLPVFYKLNGAQISNIMIDGFTQLVENKDVNQEKYIGGFFGYADKGTQLDNIHLNKVKIITSANQNYSETFYIGGLVSYATGAVINNCSVSFLKNNQPNIYDIENTTIPSLSLGGLIGYGSSITVENCFVRDLNIRLSTNESEGIGGIAGQYTGKILKCYAIGKIETNASQIGGIFGHALDYFNSLGQKISDVCQNCYAMVNIKSNNIGIGGIGGIADKNALDQITNNISLGNLYTSAVGNNININRIIGNVSSSTYVNYGYINQLINGFKIKHNDSNYLRGASYVASEDEIINNYHNMFNSKYYKDTDLINQYIPRLKYKETDEVLPNQTERKILPENPTLEIISAYQEQNRIKIEIQDENKTPVHTEDISIKISNFDNMQIVERNFDSMKQIHILSITGNPRYYLDSYEITQISYKDNIGETFQSEVSVKVEYVCYKEITSLEQWAAEFCPNYSGYYYHKEDGDGKLEFMSNQNYKLLTDINLEAIKTLNGENLTIPTNLEIGRLIGNEENIPKIYNTNLNFRGANSGLFRTIERELKNIQFEDISIKNTSGAYTGLITRCKAQTMENIIFKNITVEANNNYVGIIAYNTCTNITNIELDNISCSGNSYIGGFAGHTYPGTINQINAKNITLNAKNSYIGGVFGNVENTTAYTNALTDFNVENISITTTGSGTYIGGIFGRNYARNCKNYNEKDIKINCTGNARQVGGFAGYLYSLATNINIYGIDIVTNGTMYVGGITGYGAATQNSNIEGYIKEDGTIYNKIQATQAERVGAISGHVSGTISGNYAKNINVTGSSYVGGVFGLGISCGVNNTISQDCIITGSKNVGGIIGGLIPDTKDRTTVLNLYQTYNNNKVNATIMTAGGIIGHLDNSKMNNARYISKIYRNYVGLAEISSPQYTGSFIGKIEKPIYYLNSSSKYYYSNLLVTNIAENYPIGNIDEIQETYTIINTTIDQETNEEITQEEQVTRNVPPEETMSRLYSSLFYQYRLQNDKKVLEKDKLDNLKKQNTYTNTLSFGKNNQYYLYDDIETKFPLLKAVVSKEVTFLDNIVKRFEQEGILLPEEGTGLLTLGRNMRNIAKVETLPTYFIYPTGINTFNLEFKEMNDKYYFQYGLDKDKYSEKIPIKKRTYTFEYNFKDDIALVIGSENDQREDIISASQLNRQISTFNNQYYYLKNNHIKGNAENNDDTFIHLYYNKALTDQGYIYHVDSQQMENEKVEALKLINIEKPITQYFMDEEKIETYYHYSKIIGEEETISEYQIFNKNGMVMMLDGNLKIKGNAIIIDSYNNKEYQTVLGLDGRLYDLKDAIQYPENFENENIAQMTNNIETDENIIAILYSDDRIYVFNYITGNVIFDSNEENENLVAKIKALFKNYEPLYRKNNSQYEEAIKLEEKLTEMPIEELEKRLEEGNQNSSNVDIDSENHFEQEKVIVDDNSVNSEIGNKTSDNTENTQSFYEKQNDEVHKKKNSYNIYTTIYDADSNQYLVYKTNSILSKTKSNNKEKVISESEKIIMKPKLKEYYQMAESKTIKNTNGMALIITTIISIGIILWIMYKKKNY